jgi:hypothetical protein
MTIRFSHLRVYHHLPRGRYLILISVRSIVRLEGLGQFKNPVASSGIETVISVMKHSA